MMQAYKTQTWGVEVIYTVQKLDKWKIAKYILNYYQCNDFMRRSCGGRFVTCNTGQQPFSMVIIICTLCIVLASMFASPLIVKVTNC